MGKQKSEGTRSKNRPSSSSLAASLAPLGASSVGFGGYLGSSKIGSSSTAEGPSFLAVDNEVAQHLKRLGRKDPTTKVKALKTLSLLFKEKSTEEVVQIVPQWAYEYKSLLLDYNREVRRATHDTMATLAAVVRRGLAPYLKSLMGPWWFSQFDPISEVSQVARYSLETAFPTPEKRLDALILCLDAIFAYIDENLKLTPQSMSDKATPIDELEDVHHRVIASSLTAVTTLIDILLSKELEATSENSSIDVKLASKVKMTVTTSAEKLFTTHSFFLDFLKFKSPTVRSATYSALTIYIKNIPHAFNEENIKSLSAAILGAFREKDMSCHSSMWDMILLFSRSFPETWYSNNIHKIALNHLWQFLKNGCYGSQNVSYPALLILLESVPPKAVNGEQFFLLFFQSLWAGRNTSHSASDTTFFTAFKECFLWVVDNAARLSKCENGAGFLSIKLVNDILIKLLWDNYLQMSSKKGGSSLEASIGAENISLSDDKSAEGQNYTSSYIQELGKCIIDILSHVSCKEFGLLHDFCTTFVNDCLSVLEHRNNSDRSPQVLSRIINFFLLLGQFPLGKDQSWPWEFLAGPLIASSFPTIKTLDSVDAVQLLAVLVEIFGPAKVLSHIHICNKVHNRLISTNKDDDLISKQFLLTFEDDFVPWCLLNYTISTGAKLDLLLSLIQVEHLSVQWSVIITHFVRVEKCSRIDFGSSNHADTLQSFIILFEKLRQKVYFMNMDNVDNFFSASRQWHHELLDTATVSSVCEAPCFCSSHARLLRSILGGTAEDDNICFLSRTAVIVIFEEILKIMVHYLSTTSFHWAKHSCSFLLSMASLELTVTQMPFVDENVEMLQFAFHILEGSFFCMNVLSENGALISSIWAAIFIIDWECNLSSLNFDGDHLKNFIGNEIQQLSNIQIDAGNHLIETVNPKLALTRKVHAFRATFFTNFPNLLRLCNLSELRKILIQTARSVVFETDKVSDDVIFSLCSVWVVDLLKITSTDFNQFQCALDLLFSESNSWPFWVVPFFTDECRTATIQHLSASHEIDKLSHGRFIIFVDMLISKLGVRTIIFGCTEEASVEDFSSVQPSYSRVWLAAELLCTWRWKGGNAYHSIVEPLCMHTENDKSMNDVKIVSSLAKILFNGAVTHGTNNQWIAFCVWLTSDVGGENIEEPFLRGLALLLHTFLVKDTIWGRFETLNFIDHALDKLYLENSVNIACLKVLPYVLSYAFRSLIFQRKGLDGSTKDPFIAPSEAVELDDHIINWLQKVTAFPPLYLLKTGSEEALDWFQLVLACYPLNLQGGTGERKVEILRKISETEQNLLLSLFRKQASAVGASATNDISAVDMVIAKLTAITVAYCWEAFTDEDLKLVITKLPKWLEPTVMLMEEMAESIDDIATTFTTNKMEVISEKLEEVPPFDPLLASASSAALITYFFISELSELSKSDSVVVLQFIEHGNWFQFKDHIMENVLRIFLTTGVVEAVASSCSEEASLIIATSRLEYSLFWSLIASSVINIPDHVTTKAVESMELWGLSKGTVSALYAILFTSKPLYFLQQAAFRFLSNSPIIHMSIIKENCIEMNGLFSEEPHLLNNLDVTSEGSLCLKDELSNFILKPAEELLEMELTGNDRVNVFISWALFLTYLHSLPSSSTTRERLVQFLQDSVSSTILDFLFQHIPLKLVSSSLKKKDTTLYGDAAEAAKAAKHAINTGSLLFSMESLWPIETVRLASLAGSLYGMMIKLLPSYVRNWYTGLRDRSMSYAIEFFTKAWCSPCLLSEELSLVKETIVDVDYFSLTVDKSAYEIVATYRKEETGMDLVIRLPSCYPLRPVDVECTRSLGISELKQRKWLLSLTAFVRNQNGAIAEAIRIWKYNFDKEFDGVEECPICYSILHTINHSLPRLACKTCKHKFHSECLYKWFSTSHKSTCPLCQTPF